MEGAGCETGQDESKHTIFVNRNFRDLAGGTQRQVFALYSSLMERGIKVSLWASGRPDLGLSAGEVRFFESMRKLRSELLRCDAARIVVFGSSRRDYVLGACLARRGKLVIFSEEAEPAHVLMRWGSPFPRSARRAESERLQFLSAIPQLRFIRQDIVDSLPSELTVRSLVVPNFVEVLPTDHLDPRGQDAFIVVGCERKWKNVDSVVRAHCRRIDEGSNWSLLLYGRRLSLSRETRKMMRPGSQVFCGHEDDRAKVHLSGRVLIIASHSEGLSTVALEAVALGRPVIGFRDCVGVSAVVSHGANGLLMDSNGCDVDALANAMREVEENDRLLEQLSGNSHLMPTRFTRDRVVDQWEAVLDSSSTGCTKDNRRSGPSCVGRLAGLLFGVCNLRSPYHGLRLLLKR